MLLQIYFSGTQANLGIDTPKVFHYEVNEKLEKVENRFKGRRRVRFTTNLAKLWGDQIDFTTHN